MRRLNMFIVMAVMICVAAGSAKGGTSPGPLSSPVVNSGQDVSKAIFPAVRNSTFGQLFVTGTSEDSNGNDDKDKDPTPRSKHCPPDKDDHHKINYQDDGQKGGNNQGNDNQDNNKDHHDNCGKGDDGKNP